MDMSAEACVGWRKILCGLWSGTKHDLTYCTVHLLLTPLSKLKVSGCAGDRGCRYLRE